MAKKKYSDDDIILLKGADKVRKRPAVIFGSDGLDGCQHSVFEIISNSIDEAREGYGNKITVTRYLDKSVEVQDAGRGMPVGWNSKEQRFNWELLFCEMYAGSKYNTNDGGSYEYSLGLNGLGLCATQCASEYMDAEIHRDGKCYKLHFEKGLPAGKMEEENYTKRDTGTRIKWRPDLDVFTDIDIPLEYYTETLQRQAIVNSGVKFVLRNQISDSRFETTEFIYENGIKDYVEKFCGDEAFTSVQLWQTEKRGRDREDKPEYKVKINVALAFSKTKQLKDFYHNSSYLEHGGAPDKAVKSAFVSQIDAYLKQTGKYTKSDAKISFQDIEDCLVIIISSFSTQTSYENQTKKAITNKFIQQAMTDFLKHSLEVYFIENKLDADRIADQVLINLRSRVKAEATRLNLKKTLASSNDMANRVEKFVDCRSKNIEEREIFIVEGDSALGACKQARDSAFQAIMPVRGKILNCLKADYGKVFKSEIITDLVKVLGCGVEVNSKANKNMSTFSLDNLRWNKVIICTDADYDGFQIRTLILTMIYSLMPTLIDAGKVYIAESPLYEITSRGQTWFAYTEQEKTDALKEIGDAKYTIQRSKGLGENEPDMMWQTTMNPATRRLIKVEPCPDPAATAEKFDLLLGDNLQGRKEHIAMFGNQYIELADIS
ncbi:MAG: toprim domain-containing protein [Clostridiales bacterium]|nr:toprim domain-containing protein [Clostridiales bacterium]